MKEEIISKDDSLEILTQKNENYMNKFKYYVSTFGGLTLTTLWRGGGF